MSHYCYDFLADSPLFSESFLSDRIGRIERALPLLQEYVQHCIDNFDRTVNSIKAASSDGIKSIENPFGNSTDILNNSHLMTQAILQDVLITPDPLFSFCIRLQNRSIDATLSRAIGLNGNDDIGELQAICRYMKDKALYVEHGFLKFFPDYESVGRPGIPLVYSPTGFAESFEKSVLEWIHRQAIVSRVEQSNNRLLIRNNEKIRPCRFIHIEFSGSNGDCSMVYTLHRNNRTEVNPETGELVVNMEFSNTPPEDDYFDRWVYQSVNKTALHYLKRAQTDVSYANIFEAKFSPQNDFVLGLISESFSLEEQATVNDRRLEPIAFGVQIPESMDRAKFLKIRNDRASLFSFRCYLNDTMNLLGSLKDEEDVRKASKEIQDELTRKHLPAVKGALASLHRGEALKWIALIAGMGVGFATHQGIVSVLVALGLAAGGLESTRASVEKMKALPGYFWSRVVKKQK